MFQKHICSHWCKTHWAKQSGLTLIFEHVTWKSIGIIYLLGAIPAPSLVLMKWWGLKILSRQHSGLRRVLDLDLWTCDLKINRDIYSLRATPAPSLVLIKWRGQKILSGQHLVYTDQPTYRPTDSYKTICPPFQGGHKKLCHHPHPHILSYSQK